jgi:hypothetical protein
VIRCRSSLVIWHLNKTLGKFGVLGLFVVAGLLFIGGGVMMFMGKSSGESEGE